jgi:hypothetical protein
MVVSVAAGGAVLWVSAGMAWGQEARTPAARVVGLSGIPRKGQTNAQMEFDLPPGITLRRNPRFRVTDRAGKVVEMLPVILTDRGAVWRGHRPLRTGTYRPGTDQVQVELDTVDGTGRRSKLFSPAVTLTIP